jgi:hypothetical protein
LSFFSSCHVFGLSRLHPMFWVNKRFPILTFAYLSVFIATNPNWGPIWGSGWERCSTFETLKFWMWAPNPKFSVLTSKP